MKIFKWKRRRRGSTSPPLPGVETNPGPGRAKRKGPSLENPAGTKRANRDFLSEQDKEELQTLIESGRSLRSIINDGKFSKKVVTRWAPRLKQNNELDGKGKTENVIKKTKISNKKDPRAVPKLSTYERGEIRGCYKCGLRPSAVAARVGCSRNTAVRWVTRWIKEGTLERKSGSGRTRATLPGDDRLMKITSIKDRFLTAVDIAGMITDAKGQPKVTARTIRNRLREFGLFSRRPRKKPLLTKKQRKARYEWAKAHKDWGVEDWKKVVFSDEAGFQLFPGKTPYVRRREGESLDDACLIPTVKHGGGSILVWGCFNAAGVGVLKRIEGTITGEAYRQILIHHAMPEMKKLLEAEPEHVAWLFQHDNAPPHRANPVKRYLDTKVADWGGRLNVLPWPSQSPDLNPIESVWAYIKKNLKNRTKPSNLDELFQRVLEEWEGTPARILANMVESMPDRVAAVLKSRGGHSKY